MDTKRKPRTYLMDVYPEAIHEWDWKRNVGIDPYKITTRSGKTFYWLCRSYKHSWDAKPHNRTKHKKLSYCPYCIGARVLKDFNDLASKFPELASEWHEDNIILPTEVTSGSNISVLWKCSTCSYTWTTTPVERTVASSGCPSCKGRVVTSGVDDLVTLHPNISKLWHPTANKNLLPNQFKPMSNVEVYWLCDSGHKTFNQIASKVRHGGGCRKCSSSLIERMLYEALSRNYLFDSVEHSKKIPLIWRTHKQAVVDLIVIVGQKKIAIEYDGKYWHKEKFIQDEEKTKSLLADGYIVVRVRENDLPFIPINNSALIQFNWVPEKRVRVEPLLEELNKIPLFGSLKK